MFQLIIFSHFKVLESTFFTSLHFAPRVTFFFSKIIILNIPTANNNFIFNVKYINVNMYDPNSNLEGNFSTYVFGKSF